MGRSSNTASNQSGLIHTLLLHLVILAVGMLPFLLITSTVPIGELFGKLNAKPFSHATTSNCPAGQLQSLINNASSGSTVLVPPCIYHETISVNKSLTLDGQGQASIYGLDAGSTNPVRCQWMTIDANNVTVQGFTFKYSNCAQDNSAISVWQHTNVTFANNKISDSTNGALLGIGASTNIKILNNDMFNGGQEAFTGCCDNDTILFRGNKFHENNTAHVDINYEAGVGKLVNSTNVTWDNNEIYNNYGIGPWCDISCTNVTYSNNRIHDQSYTPLFFEISDGAKFYGNKIWDTGGYWSINVASDCHTDVYNNTIARSKSIGIVYEVRSDAPGCQGTYETAHDNNVIDPTNGVAVTWVGLSPSGTGNADYNNNVYSGSFSQGQQILTAACIPLTAGGPLPSGCNSTSTLTPTHQ